MVTEDVVALWCTQAVESPDPLVELAVEVASVLREAAASTEPEAASDGTAG